MFAIHYVKQENDKDLPQPAQSIQALIRNHHMDLNVKQMHCAHLGLPL